jgi:hypothetical protein
VLTLLLTVATVILAIGAGGTVIVWIAIKIHGLILSGLYAIGMFKPELMNGRDCSDGHFVAFILTGLMIAGTIVTVLVSWMEGEDG